MSKKHYVRVKERKPKKGDIKVLRSIELGDQITVTDYVSQAEAARILDISTASVAFLVSTGKLRSTAIAGRKVVFLSDVEAYRPKRPGPRKSSTKPAKQATKPTSKKKGKKK